MKIVLFLGAGFSRAFNLPVMNEFLAFTDMSNKLNEKDREFINNLVRDARQANSFLTSSATNLEDILSFSVMADRLSLEENESNSSNQSVRLILQKIFTQISTSNGFWSQFETPLKSFLSFDPTASRKHNISVITTNYDICIECVLYAIGLTSNPGFEIINAGTKSDRMIMVRGHLYSGEGVSVLKLHGSVNWFESQTNKDIFTVEDNIIQVESKSNKPIDSLIPYVCSNRFETIGAPYIVPPSFLKPDLRGPLKTIWKKASYELSQANLIVFIGYSFPLTDTEMMYFFARSLTNNAVLRKILLVDPAAEEIERKIKNSESKFGSHFKDFLKINPKEWQKTNLGPYL